MGFRSFVKKIGSKIVGGIKDIGSSVVKGIKTGVKGVLKFVNKLGIVGQIGLSLMLPGLGELVGQFAGQLMASGNIFGQMAGNVLNFAVNTASKIKSVVGSVTEGVVNVIGEAAGATLNKMGLSGPFKGLTKTLGFNKNAAGVAQGIDISGKTFSSMMDVARSGLEDVTKAGSNLFKLDSYTEVNKFVSPETKAKIAQTKTEVLKEIPIDQDSIVQKSLPLEQVPETNIGLSPEATAKVEAQIDMYGDDIGIPIDETSLLDRKPVEAVTERFKPITAEERSLISGVEIKRQPPMPFTPTGEIIDTDIKFSVVDSAGKTVPLTSETAKDLMSVNVGSSKAGYTAADFAEDYSRVSDSLASATSTGSYGDYTAFDIPDADQYAVEGAQLIDFFENNVRINYGGSSQIPSIYQRQSSWGQALNSRVNSRIG